MRPIFVKYDGQTLSWLHTAPQPYTVYVRKFKETAYKVFAQTDQNSIPFSDLDVQIQIRPVGTQPNFEQGDDYYIFSQDRIHTSPNLSLSFLRDIFRNQLPEQITKRFSDVSNVTQLADQLSQPGDFIALSLQRVFAERSKLARIEFKPANNQYIKYAGKFDNIFAFEYSHLFNTVRAVRLVYNQAPTFPDSYVPVVVTDLNIADIFSTNVVHEQIERGIIFEDNSKCSVQFDMNACKLNVISQLTGSVIQDMSFPDVREPGGFEFDWHYIYILDNHLKVMPQLYDYQELDYAYFDYSGPFKRLFIYQMPEYQTQYMTPVAEIRVDVPPEWNIVQIKMFSGQMLQLLEDGRVQILQPKYYSYYSAGSSITINDTFQQVQFYNSQTNNSVMQRLRKFKKLPTTLDDLLYLYGMHRSEAEEPARQLYRLFVDMRNNQHVNQTMINQILPNQYYQVTSLNELELEYGSDLIDQLVQIGQLRTQPTFSTQQFDTSDIATKPALQLKKTRYDTGVYENAVTSIVDAIQRPVIINNANPIQALNCEYMFVNETRQQLQVNSTDWHVFKPGKVCIQVQPSQLQSIIHLTELDAQLVSSSLYGKKIVLQRYPYERIQVGDKYFNGIGLINGMYQYQVDNTELAKQQVYFYGVCGNEQYPLTAFSVDQVAYQYIYETIQLSMPLEQFYLVKVVGS